LIRVEVMREIFLLLLLFFVMPATASGQGPPEGKGPEFPGRGRMMGPMHHRMEDWSRQLNLSAEQVVKLQAIRESYLRDTLVWRNELVVKRFDLRDLLSDPQSDPGRVLAKQREVSDLESKIQERTVLSQLEMRKVLTPEQIRLLPPGFGFGGFQGRGMMRGGGPGRGRE
jgi:Spy/CpxP family protein refolding chaperone